MSSWDEDKRILLDTFHEPNKEFVDEQYLWKSGCGTTIRIDDTRKCTVCGDEYIQ